MTSKSCLWVTFLSLLAAPTFAGDCPRFITFTMPDGVKGTMAMDSFSHFGATPRRGYGELCPKIGECIPLKNPREVQKQLDAAAKGCK